MSRFQSIISFFHKNRQYGMVAALAVSVGISGGHFLPHNMGVSKYRDFLQAYKNGEIREVTEKTDVLFQKALEMAKFDDFYKKFVKHFTAYGFDVIPLGSTHFKQGVLLGIPVNYAYEKPEDIERQEIVIRNKKIDWNSKQGKLLEEALLLTDDEKLFGILRGILEADSYRVHFNSLFPVVSIFLVYSVSSALNTQLSLLHRPFVLRGILYTILGCFGYGLWSFMKDFSEIRTETDVDKKLCELDPKFVAVGVSFYNKLLQRNVAIHQLTGDKQYTARGNMNYMIRQKSLPLTVRKKYFEEKLQENQNIA